MLLMISYMSFWVLFQHENVCGISVFCSSFYGNNVLESILFLFVTGCKPANIWISLNIFSKRGINITLHMILSVSYKQSCLSPVSPIHTFMVEFSWIRLTIITSITDDITADFRLRPLTAHFWTVEEGFSAFWTDWFQAVCNCGRCFHCFLSSCDSTAESSKWLWVMSWWPGNTYC